MTEHPYELFEKFELWRIKILAFNCQQSDKYDVELLFKKKTGGIKESDQICYGFKKDRHKYVEVYQMQQFGRKSGLETRNE
jgi:hypothetical protein